MYGRWRCGRNESREFIHQWSTRSSNGRCQVQRSYTIYTRSEIDIDYLWKNLAYLPITDEGETKDGLHYQFQGLTKDLLAQIKAIS